MPVLALPWPVWLVVAPLFYLFWGIIWYFRSLFKRPLWTLAQSLRVVLLALAILLAVLYFDERGKPETDMPDNFFVVPCVVFTLFVLTFVPRLFKSKRSTVIEAPAQETHHYHHYVHHYVPTETGQDPPPGAAAPISGSVPSGPGLGSALQSGS